MRPDKYKHRAPHIGIKVRDSAKRYNRKKEKAVNNSTTPGIMLSLSDPTREFMLEVIKQEMDNTEGETFPEDAHEWSDINLVTEYLGFFEIQLEVLMDKMELTICPDDFKYALSMVIDSVTNSLVDKTKRIALEISRIAEKDGYNFQMYANGYNQYLGKFRGVTC